MDLSIVILAAGQGKRMKSTLSKVMHPIGGKPMLAHVVDAAKRLSPQQIIIVHSQQADDVKAAFDDPKITFAEQATQQGTGDAVAQAMPLIPAKNEVLVLYGDVPLIGFETLTELCQQVSGDEMAVLTMVADDPTGFGRIIRNAHGTIERIVEHRDADDKQRQITEVNTGILLAKAQPMQQWLAALNNNNEQNEYYLTDIIEMAANAGTTVHALKAKTYQEVLGVNDRIQQAAMERYYQQQVAHRLLEQGVMLTDPNRIDVRGTLECQSDVRIDINTVFEGKNTLGAGCSIGPNCVLINCEIGDGANILANSHLEGAKVGKYVNVGPFARLRPGTELKEGARIGNFVEVKNSSIGKSSKINHLSYVGDATVGQHVNIGAGVITCNYDGVNKHKTIIEDEAQIGSDCQLIAPVTVGKGAMIAAGSTLKKDAPAFELTLTQRLEQRSQTFEKKTKDKN